MTISIQRASDRPGYVMQAECVVSRPIDEVFAFFSDATQLQAITPPWLHFQVLTPEPIEMFVGQRIDYRLRVRGLPLSWTSEITAWEPGGRFVDEQIRGPYSHWHHEHRFESADQGTRVIDIVHYGVPGGALVHALFVRRDIEKIFAYRQQVLGNLLFEKTRGQGPLSQRAAQAS